MIPRSLVTWVWTLLGLAAATLSFNTWSRTQSWMLEVPGLRFSADKTYGVAIFGMLWGIPLFALLPQVTRLYPQFMRGHSLSERLPVTFNLSPAQLGSVSRIYQRFFFACFLLMPMAAQIHFFDKMRMGEFAIDRLAKEGSPQAKIKIWTWLPIRQLFQESANRYQFDGVTFYPGVEPCFFLVLEIALLVFCLSVCLRLFGVKNTLKR